MTRKCGRLELWALWALGAVLLSGYMCMETGLYCAIREPDYNVIITL